MAAQFLFVTWSGGGNVHPLVALGKHVVARGHAVRVLGSSDLRERFQSEGIGFTALPPGREWTSDLADDVLVEARRQPTDVFVIDYMMPVALCAAEVVGLPCAAFVHTLYTGVAAGEFSPMTMSADIDAINALRVGLGLAPVGRVVDLLARADRVLVTSTMEFDGSEVPLPDNVRHVGPLVEDAGPDSEWTVPGTPDGGPVVLVSLGTTPMNEAPVLQNVLDALAPLPVRAFVTVGNHLDPADLRTSSNTTVSRYVRHAAVLRHTQLFVTHGGLSGVSAALAFGVPMVCVPLGREQPVNAARVEAVGAGRMVPRDASVDELRARIEEVLGDNTYGRTAARIAATIRRGGVGVRAADELEQLAARAHRSS